ncbi:MAG: CoA transferase subunit A [Syntrophales bacterium]
MKLITMHEAVERYVHDGDTIAIEGFTAFICFSAAHEIIRQQKRELTLCRMTPDVIYDQMVAAGCARKMVFSYLGNPGIGPLHCIRRAVEKGIPGPLELEEYTHFGMICRYMAGASHLPFFPLRSYLGDGLAAVNPHIKFVDSPYSAERIAVVPPLNPDLTIIHAQRADATGNTQAWGLLGVQKEAALAAKRVIVVVEEIVAESVIRSDPNRTILPSLMVEAVVHQPFGTHPSYVQGYTDRDNEFYLEWDRISREEKAARDWLDEWVYGVRNWEGYRAKMESKRPEIWKQLTASSAPTYPVNYGRYA